MATKIVTIHYPTLGKILDDLSTENPDRTKSHLDIMRDNFKKNAFEVLAWDTAVLEINHPDEHITLLWEELVGDYYALPTYGLEEDHQWLLYNSIVNAMDDAKKIWKYDEIFKEVITTPKQEK